MNNTSTKHQQIRAAGKLFENHIDTSCEYYRLTGQAEIEKTPEARTVVGRTGNRHSQMICVNAKKSQPDYKGTLKGGRSVVFEAKHTDSDRIRYGAATPTQIEILSRHDKLGAECFLLVSFGFKMYARIPYFVWENMSERYGRKYITRDEAQKYRVPLKDGVIDFLHGMEV